MRNLVSRQPATEKRMSRPLIIVAILLILTVMTFTGGIAYAGLSGPDVGEMVASSGPSVSEMLWPEGIPRTTSGAKGDSELRLGIGERRIFDDRRDEDRRDRDCRNEDRRDRFRRDRDCQDGDRRDRFRRDRDCRDEDRRDRFRRDRDCRDEDRRDRDRRDRFRRG